MRHAFLIMAHEKESNLIELLKALDDDTNDVFVHIDYKMEFSNSKLLMRKGHLVILEQRIDGAWGDFSLVEIELILIKTALSVGNYSYLHLISGVDFPVKALNYIHEECAIMQGKEFIGYSQNVTEKELEWRSQHYFLFARDFKSKSYLKRGLRLILAKFQSLIGYKRCEMEIKKGPQWWSITSDFAKYVLSKENYIRKHFKYTYCPDEMVFQTICWNSPFRKMIFKAEDEFKGCRRYIPWVNGALKSFSEVDFQKMQSPNYWFARKFSISDLYSYNQFIKEL